MSSSRIPSHQLSGGLYVSGLPEAQTPLSRPPSLSSRTSLVYTGGDTKLSGDLSKMFPARPNPGPNSGPSRPNSGPNSGPARPNSGPHSDPPRPNSGPNSGPARPKSGPNSGPARPNSGPFKNNSGPARPSSGQLGPTGLITSGRRSGQLEPGPGTGSVGKTVYGTEVTDLSKGVREGVRVSKGVMWGVVVAVIVGVMVGVFVIMAVKKAVVGVAVVVGVVVVVGAVVVWNYGWKRDGVVGYWKRWPEDELRGAVDGQYVKVTGVVTCGSIPLESSFQRVPRCVYASTELYEYRGWGEKSANPKHRFFSWGCRQAEKYVADFYISDFQSGLRALVKSGYGAKVSVFVKPTTVVDITKDNLDSSPSFSRWLSDRSLSSYNRIMRLKEGYIKEGSTVSVMGIVRRHDNVLMIVPPTESISTRCQWLRCLFPTYSEGLILLCDENQTADVIAV